MPMKYLEVVTKLYLEKGEEDSDELKEFMTAIQNGSLQREFADGHNKFKIKKVKMTAIIKS